MASGEGMPNANDALNAASNANVVLGGGVHDGAAPIVVNDAVQVISEGMASVSTSNAPHGPIVDAVALTAAQAVAMVMESMREIQARMVSMASVIGNAGDVSGARAFLRDFAVDAGRMHERLAGIQVHDEPMEQDRHAHSPVVGPVSAHVNVAPPAAIATSPVVAPVAPSISPLVATALPPPAVPVSPAVAPPVQAAVPVVPPTIPPIVVAPVGHVTPSMPSGTMTGSVGYTAPHVGIVPQSSLGNLSLPAMATFTLQADPVPWLTGLRARLNLYNLTDAARLNVAVSLLTPEVQNVWSHAYPPNVECTFDTFCEWLALNFGKHDADDDIIRKLQVLRQHGKVAAYCAEFLALWNKLHSKPDELMQIKWFRQGLQHRVHDATLFDENHAGWSSFSRLQDAVLRADAAIHSHTSHRRENDNGRDDGRIMGGNVPRRSGSFPRRDHRGGRRSGPGHHFSSHGSAPRPASGPPATGMKRSRADGDTVQCFNCSAFGHKANVCPQPRRGNRHGSSAGQRTHGAGFPRRSGNAGPSSAPRPGNAFTR